MLHQLNRMSPDILGRLKNGILALARRQRPIRLIVTVGETFIGNLQSRFDACFHEAGACQPHQDQILAEIEGILSVSNIFEAAEQEVA